jgi:hypothetical protein
MYHSMLLLLLLLLLLCGHCSSCLLLPKVD